MADVTEMKKKELIALLSDYKHVIVVDRKHVKTKHLQMIRKGLGDQAILRFGNNRRMKECLTTHSNAQYISIIPYIIGHTGLVFTNHPCKEILKKFPFTKVGAPIADPGAFRLVVRAIYENGSVYEPVDVVADDPVASASTSD